MIDPNPPKKRSTIYAETGLLADFDAICHREGQSRSDKLEGFMRQYVMAHQPGNPQQRLDVITQLGKPFKAESCQLCNSKPAYYGLKNGVWLGYCLAHWDKRSFGCYRTASDHNNKKRR